MQIMYMKSERIDALMNYLLVDQRLSKIHKRVNHYLLVILQLLPIITEIVLFSFALHKFFLQNKLK